MCWSRQGNQDQRSPELTKFHLISREVDKSCHLVHPPLTLLKSEILNAGDRVKGCLLTLSWRTDTTDDSNHTRIIIRAGIESNKPGAV